jgi:hypothetical protein
MGGSPRKTKNDWFDLENYTIGTLSTLGACVGPELVLGSLLTLGAYVGPELVLGSLLKPGACVGPDLVLARSKVSIA